MIRKPLAAAMPVIAAALVAAGPALATNPDLPVRKPGLWKISSITAATGMTTFEACITPQDSIAATPGDGKGCAAPAVKRAGDQTIVTVVCTSAEGRETTSTLFTGDFSTWYRGIAKITFDPPTRGRANLGVTLDAKYVGDCNAETSPKPH